MSIRTPAVGFINGHEVVVAGGDQLKSSEILDLNTNQWRRGPDLPIQTRLQWPSSVQFLDSFLVVGGADLEYQDTIIKFDPINYEWMILPQKLQNPRALFTAFLVPDGYIECS